MVPIVYPSGDTAMDFEPNIEWDDVDDAGDSYIVGGSDDTPYVVPSCTTCPMTSPETAIAQADAMACKQTLLDEWWEDVVVKNDANYANTKRALKITEQFIGDNNLILIGGMAIDMALKLIGHAGIYSAEKLPDYDFLSANSVGDAAKLSHLLCKAHLQNVSAINAMHTTTIKVRCNFTPAADIGYCPQEIYDELPTLKIGRLRVIHPHFQIIDIHRSLSYPFDRAQVIGAGLFYRWKKDCTRYDLLLDVYPIKCHASDCDIKKTRILLDKELLRGDCLAGWGAVSYWKNVTNGVARGLDELEMPDGEPIQVFTDDFAKYVSRADITNSNSILYFEAIMGHLPRHVRLSIAGQKYEVFDNFGALLSAEPIPCRSDATGGPDIIYVANMQHCMLWLIENIYISARGASAALKAFCHREYAECATLVSTGTTPGILPSINVFGSANLDESYLIGRRKFVARLTGSKLAEKDVIDGVYPQEPKCSSHITFDYKKSPYFAISGSRTGAFVKREIPSLG